MSAPSAILSYGSTDLTLAAEPVIRRRSDGWDEFSGSFFGGPSTSLVRGGSIPGYGSFRATEISTRDLSSMLEHDVRGLGLYDGFPRLLASEATSTRTGFDTGRESWAVPQGVALTKNGRRHSDYPNLRCVDHSERSAPVSGYKVIDLAFEGIRESKPAWYSVGTITRETVRQNFIITLSGGDSSPHNWNILTSQTSLQVGYLSLSRPSSLDVGQQGSGGGAGAFPATYTISATDIDLQWNWPNGVVLAMLDWDEIPGSSICNVRETYIKRERVSLG